MINKRIEKLLVLKGKSNSGKTTTMRSFAKLILKSPGTIKIKLSRADAFSREGADFILVVDYCGIRTILVSAGDDKRRWGCVFKMFEKYECKVGVIVVSEPKKNGCSKDIYDYYKKIKTEIAVDIIEVSKKRKDVAVKAEIATMVNDSVKELKKALDEIVESLQK